ncbi:MAG: hypothetical protein ABMA02_12990, partial [Saprospiraceae bacterium]
FAVGNRLRLQISPCLKQNSLAFASALKFKHALNKAKKIPGCDFSQPGFSPMKHKTSAGYQAALASTSITEQARKNRRHSLRERRAKAVNSAGGKRQQAAKHAHKHTAAN